MATVGIAANLVLKPARRVFPEMSAAKIPNFEYNNPVFGIYCKDMSCLSLGEKN